LEKIYHSEVSLHHCMIQPIKLELIQS
jgi:hypothetical protein